MTAQEWMDWNNKMFIESITEESLEEFKKIYDEWSKRVPEIPEHLKPYKEFKTSKFKRKALPPTYEGAIVIKDIKYGI